MGIDGRIVNTGDGAEWRRECRSDLVQSPRQELLQRLCAEQRGNQGADAHVAIVRAYVYRLWCWCENTTNLMMCTSNRCLRGSDNADIQAYLRHVPPVVRLAHHTARCTCTVYACMLSVL